VYGAIEHTHYWTVDAAYYPGTYPLITSYLTINDLSGRALLLPR